MQTLTIDSRAAAKLTKATERARAEKPLIKKTSERGVYLVISRTSGSGRTYTVTCQSATKEATCTCPAVKPCKHLAAVVPFHSFLISQSRAADPAATPAITPATATNEPAPFKLYDLSCPNCGQDFSSNVDCFFCPECEQAARVAKDESDLFGGSY